MENDFLKMCKKRYSGKAITIIGNGPSIMQNYDKESDTAEFVNIQTDNPVWTLNGGWMVYKSEIGFAMDDLRLNNKPDHVETFQLHCKEITCPLITSTAYPEYPKSIEFPLADMVKKIPFRLYHETVHYMLAFAILCGVRSITMFGCDYKHGKEPECRAGTEAWIMAASLMGIEVMVSTESALLKRSQVEMWEDGQYYGYRKDSEILSAIRYDADNQEQKYA